MKYKSVKTGNVIEIKERMFYWRNRYFKGLVDVEDNALYDYPENSFADHVGIKSSIDKGLIKLVEGEQKL